jgi:3-oxoacyl-[acyl-carrier protein] reductase
MKLQGRKVLITGGSSGIGKAAALLFAKEGAGLCLVARRSQELSEVASECRDFGAKTLEIIADITDEKQVNKILRECFSVFDSINVLVNNAGYGKYGAFASMPIEEWDRMWMVNVRGMVLVTQAIVPSMIAAKNGHIVNISSTLGIHPAGNATAYCATKFAIRGFSEALSKELWKDGVKVSTICPGGVLTPFLGISPQQKNQEYLEPEEVAEVILDVITAPGKALVQQVIITPKTRPFMVQEVK